MMLDGFDVGLSALNYKIPLRYFGKNLLQSREVCQWVAALTFLKQPRSGLFFF